MAYLGEYETQMER